MLSPVNLTILEAAFAFNLNDFEDAFQLACAAEQSLDAIVTRDPQGFVGSSLPILSPRELLAQLP